MEMRGDRSMDRDGIATLPPPQKERDTIYSVSAAIRFHGNTGDPAAKRTLPFFGCPRIFSSPSIPGGNSEYLQEWFEENDLLPILAITEATQTIGRALDVIFGSYQPQNTSVRTSPVDSYSKSFSQLSSLLMVDEFFMQQFTRGYGNNINWLADREILQNMRSELDGHPPLSSSKIVGVFGPILNPSTLFLQNNSVGVYLSHSKEPLILSPNDDFFEAGIQYSTFYDPTDTVSIEPCDEFPMTVSAEMEWGSEMSSKRACSDLDVSLHPIPDEIQILQTQIQKLPDSPSFFSPSFAKHLPPHTHHDMRIHAASFPLQVTTPIRSQSYPIVTSPPTPIPYQSRDQASYRTLRRTSEAPPHNITPISPQELEVLLKIRSLLLVDIRPFAAYAKSRLVDAVHVCIPTILLKRPSLSLDDISDTIVSRGGRVRFARWREVDGIVIYNADSLRVRDSYPLTTLAGKFVGAGFERPTYGLVGSLLED